MWLRCEVGLAAVDRWPADAWAVDRWPADARLIGDVGDVGDVGDLGE